MVESAVPILTPSLLPPPAGPTVVKVEPRNSRQRKADAPEVVSRPITEQYLTEPREYRHPEKVQSRLFSRLLISLIVVSVMAAISIGLILYFQGQAEKTGISGSTSKTLKILPDEEIPQSPALPSKPAPPPAVTPPPAAVETAPKPAKAHPGIAAMAVLEKFLAAASLEERLPLIETKLPKAELEASILTKPFPANPQIAPDIQEANPADGSIDMFYNVDFKTSDGKNSPQLVLVRVHGEGAPKVIVDPFLDTFGGRLASYASAPSDKPATFHVIISAVAQTTSDRNVPNYENKLRLKLMPRDNEKEIANAYFTKLSKIGQMITTEGSGFRYGQARTAKVTLQWNKTEDPQMPFLEAIDIKEFRWNP